MAIEEDTESGASTSPQHEPTEPLIKAKSKESVGVVLLGTGVAVWGSFEFGTCVGYSAPTQSGIRDELGLSLSEYSVFGSILTIGAMIGAVTSGRIADFVGRKGAMWFSSIVCTAGWLAIHFAEGPLPLDIGRICTGYGIGILSYVVPVFVAEISPKNLRGGLTTINQLMICLGASMTFIIGTIVTWRNLVFIGIFPCMVLFLGLFLIPESPRWLAKVGRQREFEASLQRLRGQDADIFEEAEEIKEYIATLQTLPKATFVDLFKKSYIRATMVGVGLMFFQQFNGINGIGFYASQLFVDAGFPSGDIGTISMACIQVPIVGIGALLMDKSGRKPLLMVSASGTFVGIFLAAMAFYLKGQGLYLDKDPLLALIGILVYMGSFAIGMGAIPWIIMSEVFPINVKGIGGSMVTLMNWFGSWVMSYSFNFLMSWSSSGTLFMFSAVCALTVLFVAKFVPETKGRTLEEIQASLNS